MIISITVDGVAYEVARPMSPTRAIINCMGLFVIADMVEGVWELSGDPASAEETTAIEQLTASMQDVSVLTVAEE